MLPNYEQVRTIEDNHHHCLTTGILQIHNFQYQFFQNLILIRDTKEQNGIYSHFLRNYFDVTTNLFGTLNSLDACINFPSQFSQDEFLPFLATSDNRHPHFYNLLDFPVARFTHLTFDNHSIDKPLELHPSVRPNAKHTPQLPSIDTTSDVSLQTHPSSCNVLVYTHKIGNTPPKINPLLLILSITPLLLNL